MARNRVTDLSRIARDAGRPWIAYVAPFSFPDGGAGARRVFGISQSLVSAGFQLTIVSAQTDLEVGVERGYVPGISVVSTGERSAEHLPRAAKRARYVFMGGGTSDWIASQPVPPSAVILYSGYTPYLFHLVRLCSRLRIPLMFDAVEWYSASSRLKFLFSPYFWNTEFAMRVLIPRLDGTIAISSWLEKYYGASRKPVCRVPPTLDVSAVEPRLAVSGRDRGRPLRLAYCGSASNDLLDVVVGALLRIDPSGRAIRLDIAGPSPEELSRLPSLRRGSCLPACVRLHGRLRHDESLALTRAADFSIFLRRINRVSTAGFPTKFVESLAVGTPVITNLTSDIGRFLEDGRNGLVCAAPQVEALVPVLRRAIDLTDTVKQSMRAEARQCAAENFDYRLYTAALCDLLTGVGVDFSGVAQ